ncbi:NfeD family protein [Chloroflexota bacterium]
MTARLIIAIISTILEEAAIAFGVLWGLPQLGVQFPLWALIVILVPVMVVWLFYSLFTYRKGTIALKQAQLLGMPDMVGTNGVVISPLAPEGLVRINAELWVASSVDGELATGVKVIVIDQERLKIVVRAIGDTQHS